MDLQCNTPILNIDMTTSHAYYVEALMHCIATNCLLSRIVYLMWTWSRYNSFVKMSMLFEHAMCRGHFQTWDVMIITTWKANESVSGTITCFLPKWKYNLVSYIYAGLVAIYSHVDAPLVVIIIASVGEPWLETFVTNFLIVSHGGFIWGRWVLSGLV